MRTGRRARAAALAMPSRKAVWTWVSGSSRRASGTLICFMAPQVVFKTDDGHVPD